MKKSILSLLFVLFIATLSGCVMKDTPATEPTTQVSESYTFYAAVTSITDSGVLYVKGLEVNDINYRGKFAVSTTDKTKFTWRGTDISITDLKPNDIISIQFSGDVQETEPASLKADRIYYLGDRLDKK
ncbi:MAG: hypothetical protein Q4G58_18005 [bacterium]|nr:hypothetical protein [bacterium]